MKIGSEIMKNWISKLANFLLFVLVGTYFLGFLSGYLFYFFSSLQVFLIRNDFAINTLLTWIVVGVSLSLLATLACWPFALSVATLLEHNKSRQLTPYFVQFLNYFSTLPLVIFVYIYIEVIGAEGFSSLESFWIRSFASTNLFTQAIAFALTLLLYPLTVLPFFPSPLTVDSFFRDMLRAVIEFAEVGLVASVIVIGLFLYILPKMILHMRELLKNDESFRSFETIQSLGGTPWESIHLTVMQSMKNRFNEIIAYFSRICFFEGLITFTLLHFFFLEGNFKKSHWGSSLSSVFMSGSVESLNQLGVLLGLSGMMVLCYILFAKLESYFRGGGLPYVK